MRRRVLVPRWSCPAALPGGGSVEQSSPSLDEPRWFLEGCLRPIGHRLQPDADYRKELGYWHSFDRADDEAGSIAFAAAVVI
jgi:hypothetical protein